MTLVIAGERSGVGKTTVTLALLAALRRRANQVQSFKVGPDYIDPMFHQAVTGRACRNLDPVLTSEAYVQECFACHTQAATYALVEGVMGLFDGAGGVTDWASTAHIARLLDLPVLLVLDCSRMARSIAAIAHGYKTFDPRLRLAGWVLNRVGSDRHLELLEAALEPLQIPILGVLRRQDGITIPDRHLGLVPTEELTDLRGILEQLAHLGEQCFNWERLLPLLQVSPLLNSEESTSSPQSSVRIGVARDRAFNFYYADNLDSLEQLGAELVFWSPLEDQQLPPNLQGLYFGGGFPEVFASALADNAPVREAVRQVIQAGLPTYAECGGLMYLCQSVVDFDRQTWPMVGILPTEARMGDRLTLGYRRAVTLQDSPLLPSRTEVWGHEFHRSSLSIAPIAPLYQTQGYQSQQPLQGEGWNLYQLHASYIHLHFGAKLALPSRFVQFCANP
ncbi:cobyrinic acid a,c-diamide synthase [Leptolyngbya sp. 'hensonii']|uniref:cobyrinate a,c-diamide synthase n=1 Tax=Leptolyngbya sp. 'hensonii' TaxID=1922337 RepID=UPI00094FD54E|nr:cobyrinate a,c-diamide synthase [Leptolyngbya sp. 'hensonii']OLP15977.1 cobyrinic acid a,c-diamide synthase [Leptolyngbya sp. 'hensonii']